MAEVLDCDIVVSSNSSHTIIFSCRLNTLRSYEPSYPPYTYELNNNTTTILLKGCFGIK